MASVAHGIVHAAELPSMGHQIECEIYNAAPNILDGYVPQLRVDTQHIAAQDCSALPQGMLGRRHKASPAPEEHTSIGGEAKIVQIVFRVEDHTLTRAKLA